MSCLVLSFLFSFLSFPFLFFLFSFLVLEIGGLSLRFLPGAQTLSIYCAQTSQRSRPQPRRACCLELSFVEGRTACSLNQQIPRWEPIQGCHVFPDEIPDLVCCVFLKNTPTASKNLSRGETFLVELPVFEMVSDYAPLPWPAYTALPMRCFCGEPPDGRECLLPSGTTALHSANGKTEARRSQGGEPHAKLVSGPQPDPDLWIPGSFSSSFIRGHKRAACGHLYPTDVLSLARECFNLNEFASI